MQFGRIPDLARDRTRYSQKFDRGPYGNHVVKTGRGLLPMLLP